MPVEITKQISEFEEITRGFQVFETNAGDIDYDLGTTLLNLEKFGAAIPYLQRAAVNNKTAAIYGLAQALHALGHDARTYYERAACSTPRDKMDCRCQADAQLLLGDFTGFRLWESSVNRLPHEGQKSLRSPIWDGSKCRSILLFNDAGIGDAIQFVRFAKLVKERVDTVYLFCSPSLHRLFSTVEGIDVTISDKETLIPEHDFHCQLMHLPGVLGITIDTIPPIPTLYAHPCAGVDKRYQVGVVWRGNRARLAEHHRSMKVSEFAQFLDGLSVVSLQLDATDAEIELLKPALNAGPMLHDLSDTAGFMGTLDLVISVDTGPAHLAASLDVPVWILLSRLACWRWLLDRSDSPWYRSARLFRQEKSGDWAPVIDRVRAELNRNL